MTSKKFTLIISILSLFLFMEACAQPTVQIDFGEVKTAGYLVIRGWTQDSTSNSRKVITLDSIHIDTDQKTSYLFQYKKLENPMTIYMQLKEKNDTSAAMGTDLFFINHHVTFMNWKHGNILLDNSDIKINVLKRDKRMYVADVLGSPETDVFYILDADFVALYDNTKKTKRRYTNELDVITDDSLIQKHPSSKHLLSHIINTSTRYKNINVLEKHFSLLSKELQESQDGQKLLSYITTAKKNNISSSFAFYDISSKKYNFDDFIQDKKYGLLIFWASWCGPCRAEIPELKQLYQKHKDKVAFVSLSLDENKNDWTKAVKKDNLEWLSLSGMPESKQKVSRTYNVNTVPSFIIVDSTGKILLNAISGFNMAESERKFIQIKDIDKFFDTKE